MRACYPTLMSAQHSSEEQFELVQQTAVQNLIAWKVSGVVKTLRWYSAEDADACAPCRARHGAVVNTADAAIGVNLPPLSTCSSARCRCYFRPSGISLE
jgi:SPP1 gp7 family putative phage head morphogenesis protein